MAILQEDKLLNNIDGLIGQIDEVLARSSSMSAATEIVKSNAATAVKTGGANAVNKKFVATVQRQLAEAGITHPFFETQTGHDVLMNLVPVALIFAATNPTVAGSLPPGLAHKILTVATCASQGAMNETADRLIQSVVPFLNEYADLADQITIEAPEESDSKVASIG